MYKSETYGRI